MLGSGDGSQAYQRFTLRSTPLTYTGAATPSGLASTLEVRVNDVLWHEVPTLYGARPADRVYVTRRADDGATTVQFGDGRTGARLPSGRDNVKATYRKGSGAAGLVQAGQLTLLLTRPLGVRDVNDPVAPTGGDDPESRDDARANAPLTVRTLDRVVSLQDYEDFARAYSGIAKARATWTRAGLAHGIFLTVAGPDGAPVPESSGVFTGLLAALRGAGDPYVPVQVATYRPAYFRVTAVLTVDPDYDPALVTAAVAAALAAAFGFAAREFGAPVLLSQVLAVMQGVAGVVAVDLETLYRTGDSPALNPVLAASGPQPGTTAGAAVAAELLTLDPSPPALTVQT